ncbi:lycopene cyclase family protein [Rhodococcus tibetensis]|uniref:Lycopene cyclase family protein n=1 Tax=Rhodococcus tibetensis TaxID=2965064 RepID=A0ABT1Q8D9_9NOCA|nr:lycopene cyclase family protein [Rhodococcus sp. FXJ9.536]MCQ4118521.1 lycopene cyclase family protein [Rhodococcus sp. FXJ9.536]
MTAAFRPPMWDVAIVGLGPAGRALAYRATTHGLTVVTIDPHPARNWTATYGAWEDELPHWLPQAAIATRTPQPTAWTTRRHAIERTYCVLDTPLLQSMLSEGTAAVIAGRAVDLSPTAVLLSDGTSVGAHVVVDARGTGDSPDLAQQTAYGVAVDADTAAGALGGEDALFMDWRTDNGTSTSDQPSFLYAVPLSADRFLLEETCLVGRPALAVSELATRLHRRLRHRGVSVPSHSDVERVRFAVEPPHDAGREGNGQVRFGARAGLMHPSTGYSVAASLSCADALVRDLAEGTSGRLWPWRARTVASLRSIGLRVLLRLDAESVPEFFEHFFDLPPHLQVAFLSDRANPTATLSAMRRMFFASSGDIRGAMLRSALRRELR